MYIYINKDLLNKISKMKYEYRKNENMKIYILKIYILYKSIYCIYYDFFKGCNFL